jgi:outer membrane lipoprotein-sorting protein
MPRRFPVMPFCRIVGLLLLCGALSTLVVPASRAIELESGELETAEAEALLQRVEARYAKLRSFQTSFRQTYRSAALGQEVVETGRLYVERPRMRWDYRRPDKKVFLIEEDGSTLAYVPADRTATRSRMPADAPHLQLLLGRGRLLESFEVKNVKLKQPLHASSTHLRLRPRKPRGNIDTIYLEIDAGAAAILRVLLVDSEGNESDLQLDRVKENVAFRESTFRLRLPRGIEVRDLGESAGR